MKKKHPEHVNLERWLVSYADFITLLFAFFVVMYAISQADLTKLATVSKSIRAAFGAAGASGMLDLGGKSGGNTANFFDNVVPPGGRMINLPAGKTHTAAARDSELQDLKEKLEETVSLELGITDLSDKLQMIFDSRGLVVRLAAKDFFDQGEVEVAPDLRPLLDRIGRVLVTTSRFLRVEGHTDISERSPPGYASSWELSSARAAWVAKYWMRRFKFDPRRVGVAGYSHYRPLSTDKSEWGRGSNRRVEVIVLNNRYKH